MEKYGKGTRKSSWKVLLNVTDYAWYRFLFSKIQIFRRFEQGNDVKFTSQSFSAMCSFVPLFKLSTTVTQLLFGSIAHFDPFLAPFLLVLTILCFHDTKIC